LKVIISCLKAVSTQQQANLIQKLLEENGYEVEFKSNISATDVRKPDNVAFMYFTLATVPFIGSAVFPAIYAKQRAKKPFASYVTVEGIPTKAISFCSNIPKLEFIANSNFTGECLTKAGLNVIDVVHHALDIALCDEAISQSRILKEQLNAEYKDKCKFVYVGRDDPRKGLNLLSVAIDILNEKRKDDYVVLLHSDSTAKNKLPQDNVILRSTFGSLPYFEVLELIAACDYMVFPSVCEGFGLPVLEANGVGIPVVHAWFPPLLEFSSKDFNFVFDYVEEKEVPQRHAQFWLFHNYTPEALADMMSEAIDVWKNKPKEYIKFCGQAKAHAENWDYHKIYPHLLKHLGIGQPTQAISKGSASSQSKDINVLWHGPFSWTGYGQVSRNCVLSLDFLGVNIKAIPATSEGNFPPTDDWTRIRDLTKKPVSPRAIRIAHLNPNHQVARARYNIRYTVWEATKLPSSWVSNLNKENEVWVPSSWCKDVFKSNGVKVPIYVIPHGVDLQQFNTTAKPLFPDNRFTFLFIGDSLPRKGLDLFLKAFKEEFGEDEPVRALVRLYGGDIPVAKNIQVVRDLIHSSNMAGLYRSAQCYVMTSRGEGYGICCLEALACGIPVIYTNWSGPTEFMSRKVGYPVSYSLVKVKDMPHDYVSVHGKAEWAEIDLKDLRRTMRHVYNNYDEAVKRAVEGQRMVWSKYSWVEVAKIIEQRLKEIGV